MHRKRNSKIKVGVIAAAGKGTRAYPRTSFIPKPLFEFDGRSLLARNAGILLNDLKVDRLYIVVGHLKDQVMTEVDAIRKVFPKKSIHTVEWTQKGLASDIASLRDRIDEDFIVILGDEFYVETNHSKIQTSWQSSNSEALICIMKSAFFAEIRKNYSVQLEGTKVSYLVEKPHNPPNDLLGLGTYVFSKKYFASYDSTPESKKSGVIEITDVVDGMAKEGRVDSFQLKGRYFNINSLADYYSANYVLRTEAFQKYSITLVLPTLNNESTLLDTINDFKSHVDEIIVADGGSSDHTVAMAKQIKTKVLTFKKTYNVHNGDIVYDALDQATGDIIVLAPADGSFRAKDMPKLLEYLKDSDLVVGTRTTRQMIEQGSNLSPLYRWLNVGFGKLVEICWWNLEPRYTDIGCIFRAIWKDSYTRIRPELQSTDRTFSVEMMIEVMRAHMRCIEVPVSYFKRYASLTENSFREQVRYFFSVLRLIITRRFLRS